MSDMDIKEELDSSDSTILSGTNMVNILEDKAKEAEKVQKEDVFGDDEIVEKATNNNEDGFFDDEIDEKSESANEELDDSDAKESRDDSKKDKGKTKEKKPMSKKDKITLGAIFGTVLLMGSYVAFSLFSSPISVRVVEDKNDNMVAGKVAPIKKKKKQEEPIAKKKIESVAKIKKYVEAVKTPQVEKEDISALDYTEPSVIEKKETLIKEDSVSLVANNVDIGVNSFVVVGGRVYLDVDLFEDRKVEVSRKIYYIKYNGKKRAFIKIIGSDIFLLQKQVLDNYSKM